VKHNAYSLHRPETLNYTEGGRPKLQQKSSRCRKSENISIIRIRPQNEGMTEAVFKPRKARSKPVTGHGPPDDRHDGSAEDHKDHQDSRSAGVKPHDVVVTDLDSLEEAHLGPSQNDEMRGESVVCRE
jgi:hypothetical protein